MFPNAGSIENQHLLSSRNARMVALISRKTHCFRACVAYNFHSMGPVNIIIGCLKSPAKRLVFKLNSQHLIVILRGPMLMSNVMAIIESDSKIFLEIKSIVYDVYSKTQINSNYNLILWIKNASI